MVVTQVEIQGLGYLSHSVDLQSIKIHLNCAPTIQCAHNPSQFCVVCKLVSMTAYSGEGIMVRLYIRAEVCLEFWVGTI